jgi:proteasome lid subunit RPN8/RPN11
VKRRELLETFRLLTDLSSQIGREVAVCACRKGDEYRLCHPASVGDVVSAVVYCRCGEDEKAVIFHTHVLSPPLPSEVDLKPLVEGRAEEVCIGARVKDGVEIRCYYPCGERRDAEPSST